MTSHLQAGDIPSGIRLCALEEIADPGARSLVLQIGEQRFHGFVVRHGVEVFGYADQCPHMGLPLAQQLDEYLTPEGTYIACSWHGALFRIEDGGCVGGPCSGAHLAKWAISNRNGQIYTGS